MQSLVRRPRQWLHRRFPSVVIILALLFVQLVIERSSLWIIVALCSVLCVLMVVGRRQMCTSSLLRRLWFALLVSFLSRAEHPHETNDAIVGTPVIRVIGMPDYRRPDVVSFVGEIQSDRPHLVKKRTHILVHAVLLPWRNSALIEEGSVVAVKGTFRNLHTATTPYAAQLLRKGIEYEGRATFVAQPLQQTPSMREYVTSNVRKVLTPVVARYAVGGALLESMAFSLGERVPPWTEELYKYTGLMHLVVISGMQITMLYGAVFGLISLLCKKILFNSSIRSCRSIEMWMNGLTFAAVGSYVYITGAEDATVRALIIVGLAIFARRYGLGVSVLTLTLGMMVISLLTRPGCLYELSFQLTVGALMGIALGIASVADLHHSSSWKVAFRAALGATAITSLLCALQLSTINSFALLYNILFCSIISFVSCPIGIPCVVIDTLRGVPLLSYIPAFALEMITSIIEWFSQILPYQDSHLLGISISLLTLSYLVAGLLRNMRGRSPKRA